VSGLREDEREAIARALWLADDYDLDADPTSRTAREMRPDYERRADALAPIVAAARADERERVARQIDAHAQGIRNLIDADRERARGVGGYSFDHTHKRAVLDGVETAARIARSTPAGDDRTDGGAT
jgi:hypothetical protein